MHFTNSTNAFFMLKYLYMVKGVSDVRKYYKNYRQ